MTTMDICFYKADSEAPVSLNSADSSSEDGGAGFAVVLLERDADPDSLVHDGFDYYGAFGDGEAIHAWAADQPVTPIESGSFPVSLSSYPAPFNEA